VCLGLACAAAVAPAQVGPSLTPPRAAEPLPTPSPSATPTPPATPNPPAGAAGAVSPQQLNAEELPAPQAPAGEVVLDVRIDGNRDVPLEKIRPHISTRPGRAFDERVVQEDIRRLNRTRQFLSVRVDYLRQPEGVVVVFRVVERPTLEYVKYVGNYHVSDRRLERESGLKVGGPLDPYSVEEARRKLLDFYHQRGRREARIDILEGNKLGDRGAVFVIYEGEIQRVRSIRFIGNTIASDARLKTQIESRTPIAWIFGGHVDLEKIDGDVDRLTAYYRSLGFFKARIGRELVWNDNRSAVDVTFVIDEGPRYQVRNVAVLGATRFRTEDLEALLKLQPGQFFDQPTMTQDIERLKETYGGHGYIFAQVQAEPRFLEEPGQLDLVYNITEGDRYRVGRVEVVIRGENPHTSTRTVLNRLSLQPGDIIDIREIRASERRLRASGLFETADPSRVPRIVVTPREEEEAIGKRPAPSSRGFRGQSPDAAPPERPQAYDAPRSAVLRVELPAPAGSPRGSGLWESQLARGSGLAIPAPSTAGEPAAHVVVVAHRWSLEERDAAQASAELPPGVRVARPPEGAAAAAAHGPFPWSPRSAAAGSVPRSVPEVPRVVRAQSPAGAASPYDNPANPVPPPRRDYPPSVGERYASPAYGYPQGAVPLGGNTPYAGAFAQPGAPGAATGQAAQPAPVTSVVPETGPQVGQVFQGPPVPQTLPGPLPPLPGSEPGLTPPDASPFREPTADITAFVEETRTGRFSFGVGINSDAGVVGNIVLDETNFDITRVPTSFQDVLNGTAFRGAGQRFRMEAVPGSVLQRYLVSFNEPYLWDTPISFGTSAYFFDRLYNDWSEQRIGGTLSLGYQLRPDLAVSMSLRGENVNVRNPRIPTPPELAAVLGDNELYAVGAQIAHDTRDSDFLPTEGHLVQLGFEQYFGEFDFPRFTADARQYFLVRQRPDRSGRHVVSVRGRVGITGTNTPVFEHFFAGGFSTLRGFDFRGASPVNMGVTVGGDFMLLGSTEYLFPLTADDALRMIVFVDFGTVEPRVRLREETFRVAPGVGLRIKVPGMGEAPIALDFAWAVARADTDDTEVFSFFVGFLR
jgi:outer membrane protein insertion porin family